MLSFLQASNILYNNSSSDTIILNQGQFEIIEKIKRMRRMRMIKALRMSLRLDFRLLKFQMGDGPPRKF